MLRLFALALLLLLPAAASAQELDAAVAALVRISGTRGGTPVRGSGFVVALASDRATIVTASHVIEGVEQLEVSFAVDTTTSRPAGTVLGMDSGNPRGLAAFQVRGTLPSGLTALNFDIESRLLRGEELYLMGFPQMATAPLTLRRVFSGPAGNLLQLDMPVGEGFSGSPVLRKGRVVGVVVDEDTQLTFAVKALVAQDAVLGWGAQLGGPSDPTEPPPRARTDTGKCVPGEQRSVKGIAFVHLCGGTFVMGSAKDDPTADADEKPAHPVTLSELWMGKTEITNGQYGFLLQKYHEGEVNLPVVDATWENAEAACRSLGGRLPTEAEWEYAARAGSTTAWAFGADERHLGDYAWFRDNAGGKPHPVGTKKANAWGLHDLYGNAWEWVADWYGLYSGGAQTDPTGPAKGEQHILRGGCFANRAEHLRTTNRHWQMPGEQAPYFGFRCVLGAQTPATP
ncbi:MAG TPA: SUMF1/EgtB/PvdO family nonheme iron enzyme [Thermoanaerobaculia bacterium]|nr:SUMF1/EgtB/PvdO family nonheme iron enzyme [Thermoanaerobaculia bacterium]